jgi:Tfp pilus assembly protein PilV
VTSQRGGSSQLGAGAPACRTRDGITLIEVMLALVMLAMIIVSNTNITLKFAERQQPVALGAYRSATLTGLIDSYMTMPYDSLSVRTGCTTVTASQSVPFGYTSCVTVTSVTPSESQVQIILSPAALTRKDTVTFNRGKSAVSSPLGG